MFSKLSAVFLLVAMLFVIGCAAHTHTVGNGPQGTDVIQARQWYALWGLAPLNEVDTKAMAGRATDYEITTEVTVVDAVINGIVSSLTIYCRSVTVVK